MRRLALGFLLLAAGCRSPQAFGAGHMVHFLIHVKPRPEAEMVVRPVVTVGDRRAEATRTFAPDGPAASEVAVFRVQPGEHEIAVSEPGTGVERRATEDVDHETWVILTIDPRTSRARLSVEDAPPAGIGRWEPLVPIPD